MSLIDFFQIALVATLEFSMFASLSPSITRKHPDIHLTDWERTFVVQHLYILYHTSDEICKPDYVYQRQFETAVGIQHKY